jgi:HD superfamily phosphohydrolase
MPGKNKKKIFNDPIYGLIRFPHKVLYDIIDHPYFQRLRRISQQALSHYVYPGAMHTRFQHAIGATHLMCRALDILKSKGVRISKEEHEAVCMAILLHDIGHGPFSHALEHVLAEVHHEDISKQIIRRMGEELGLDFSLVLLIFTGQYHRPFLHQLVSGQIDVDRMDYLTRDSFFSGVAEGIIGYDRIIMMMDVKDDQLVIEEKGIYSIEKFLMARRLMYWQVYLHKTVIAAEIMLISTLRRAKYLAESGVSLSSSEELNYFLSSRISQDSLANDDLFIRNFVLLDDTDILWLIKKSVRHPDKILSQLSQCLIERRLMKVSTDEKISMKDFDEMRRHFAESSGISEEDTSYFFETKEVKVDPYDFQNEILIQKKSGKIVTFSHLGGQWINNNENKTFFFMTQDFKI